MSKLSERLQYGTGYGEHWSQGYNLLEESAQRREGVDGVANLAGLADDEASLGEVVIFNGDDEACGTPPTPVAVATYVPDGAASDVAKRKSVPMKYEITHFMHG